MTERFFANSDGTFWGTYDGPDPAPTETETPGPPPNGATYLWDGSAWNEDPALVDDSKDGRAGLELNTPLNLVLRDLFWDLEKDRRTAGGSSEIPEVAGATTKAEYTAALKTLVKAGL